MGDNKINTQKPKTLISKAELEKRGFRLETFINIFSETKTGYICDYYMFIGGTWHIVFKRDGFASFITYNYFLTRIEYVEQLDALYYGLTGEILKIKNDSIGN